MINIYGVDMLLVMSDVTIVIINIISIIIIVNIVTIIY
jgi:hypothetical protein